MNIGPKESRKRIAIGATSLIVALLVAIVLVLAGLDRWWRLGLFLPFWLGSLGFFQAREKT